MLATGVLVAATVAVAGQRPGVNARLCAIWALWGVLCLAGLFLLRHADHIGADVIVALAFCAVLANAAERELTEALPPAPARHAGRGSAPSSGGARAVLAVFRTNGRIERRRPPLVTAIDLPASRALAAL